jgi:hypothetical protein
VSNPLVSLGRWAFKFALAYSAVSTVLATALAASGLPVPDPLLALPLRPEELAARISDLASKGPTYAAFVGGGTMAIFAVFNFAAGIAIGIPKLFYHLAAAVDPALVPVAAIVGGILTVAVFSYLLATVVGSVGG